MGQEKTSWLETDISHYNPTINNPKKNTFQVRARLASHEFEPTYINNHYSKITRPSPSTQLLWVVETPTSNQRSHLVTIVGNPLSDIQPQNIHPLFYHIPKRHPDKCRTKCIRYNNCIA